MSRTVFWKDWIAVLKIQVTANVINFNECSSGRYLLDGWTFCKQTWNNDASSKAGVSRKKIGLLSSKSQSRSKYDRFCRRVYWNRSSAFYTKWAYTDVNTEPLSITRHTLGGGGGIKLHNDTDFVYLGNYVNFGPVSSDEGKLVWRHNTFLSQAILVVNGIVLTLASGVKQNLILKWSVDSFNVKQQSQK